MPTQKTEKPTKEKLVEAAAYLIHRRGYHGVGVSEILKLAKAPKGVLYHHFPGGKPELGEAAIDYAAAVFNAQVIEATKDVQTISEYVDLLGQLTIEDLVRTGFKAGCPLTTVALETAPDDKRLSNACRRGFDLWIDTMSAQLQDLGAEDPKGTAELILASLEGALAIARPRKDASIVAQCASMLAQRLA